jgi:hypothetical protein
MKKKVRIFKAGGDTGAYLNKTAQWMMQIGGTPDISQIGYPSQQPQQVSEEDITNLIISDLSNQIPEDQIAFKLVTIHKLEPVVAQQFIGSVKDMLVKQNEEGEDEDVQEERVAEAEMFTNEEEPEFETEDEQALYQNTLGQDDDDDTEFAADLIMKYGGSKRNYVNSVLKLVKKQMGGDTKSDDTDPIGENVRKKQTDSFVNTVKNQAVIAQVKDQAEKQYEQMMQQQALQNFIPNYEEQDYMQFGGQRRAMRQFNKAMRNLPVTMQPVTKFDVRRSGLFGRPKEYSIEFGMNPLMQLANPMLASMYGYGRVPTGTKSQGRIVTETVAKANNKNSTKEVASQTNSEAAAKSAQPTLEEMRAAAEAAGDWNYTPEQTTIENNRTSSTASNTTRSNTVPNNTENTQTSVENENNTVVKPSIKKDKWGRPEGSEWYNYDPDNAKKQKEAQAYFKQKEAERLNQINSNNPAMYMAPDGTYKYRPMSALADDDLISTIVMGGLNWKGILGSPLDFVANKMLGSGAKKASSKLGSAAAKQFLGKGQNMLNPGQKMLNQGQNMLNRGQGMLNPGQKMLNPPPGYQYRLPFQSGGVVNNPFVDPYGNLQKFISGGYDPSQADIDDMYAKDTSDPYFRYGGLTKAQNGIMHPQRAAEYTQERSGQTAENCRPPYTNCFPRKTKEAEAKDEEEATDYETRLAQEKKKWEQEFMQRQNPFGSTPNMLGNFGNQIMGNYGFYNPLINNRALPGLSQYMGSWNKMVGTPYDKRTGQQFMGIPGFNPNAQISNIDVTKTGILGRPKKFSVTYNNNPSGKPEDRRLAGSSFTGMPNMNTNSKSYGNQPGRQRPFYVGKKYETDFEETDNTPRLGNLEYMQQAKANNSKQDTDYTKQFQEQQKAKGLMWNESLNKWVPSTQEQLVNSQTNLEKVRPVGNITYEQRNRAMSPSPEKLNELYNKDVFNDYKYGGLHKFLPQAQPGVQTPVTQDERFEPLPMMSSKQAGQNLFNQSRENIMSQAQFEPDQYTQDFKRKDIFGGNAAEALPWINAGVLGAAGMINRYRDKDREAAMYENLTADNLYASDPSRDRGDYETNSGLYRPDEMGQKWNSRSKQFGGEMDYEEGDEVDMTEEELEEFLANGGEIY